MGALSRPAIPKIAGMDRFKGKMFHSACWDHAYNLAGKNVAVVGTGASAIQFIPKIAPQVGRLSIFQRTPSWILPKFDFTVPAWLRLIFRFLPGSLRALRWLLYCYHEACGVGLWNPKLYKPLEWLTRRHIAKVFADPRLKEALSPDYTMGCKRILIANDYFETLLLENVELFTAQIAEIREHHIITQDRQQRRIDAIIFATGFRATDLLSPLRLVGRNEVELAEAWCKGPTAFYGMTIAGFPNLFMLVGPNSLLAHNSVIFMIERQVHYVCESLRWVTKNRVPAIELRRDVQDRFNQRLQERLAGTAWLSGCNSWYLDERGKNVSLWPGSSTGFWLQTRRFVPDDYRLCV
jgi:cation diffusion facilitator CzcD-associated flavoprotein CzcO